jgi:hypothetical protein
MAKISAFGKGIFIVGAALQAYVIFYNGVDWSLDWIFKSLLLSAWVLSPFYFYSKTVSGRPESVVLKVYGFLLIVLHCYFVWLGTRPEVATAGMIFYFTPLYEVLLILTGMLLADYLGRRPGGS